MMFCLIQVQPVNLYRSVILTTVYSEKIKNVAGLLV